MTRFTNTDKWKEATREVSYRKRVYERLVADKGMRRELADRRIAIMSEIAEDYRKLAEQDEPAIKFPDSY
ncbi:MAG TPA: hypothetical protein VKE42_02405 [Candidatus Cybelea sp.]|nr:hypothetical protein [Candidatus Cybelea sp.]